MEQKIMDGNSACSYVSYNFTEVAGIYPITPASTMAEKVDEYSASGKTNMFGDVVKVVEMQSEAGAARNGTWCFYINGVISYNFYSKSRTCS